MTMLNAQVGRETGSTPEAACSKGIKATSQHTWPLQVSVVSAEDNLQVVLAWGPLETDTGPGFACRKLTGEQRGQYAEVRGQGGAGAGWPFPRSHVSSTYQFHPSWEAAEYTKHISILLLPFPLPALSPPLLPFSFA